MLKKFKGFKQFIAGVLVGAIMFGSVGVFAETVKSIQATLNNVKISVNGKTLDLKDSKGNPLQPINYNNTNYLPVRAIAESLDMNVGFNSVSNTIELTGKEENVLSENTTQIVNTEITTNIPNTTTTQTLDNALVSYNENGLVVVETQGEKYIEAYSLSTKLQNTNFRIFTNTSFGFYLQKKNNVGFENVSTFIKYRHDNDESNIKRFNNGKLYISYNDYLNIIKPLIGE
jgi:hypothetical protein